MQRKLRLTLQQILWLDEVYQYIKRYGLGDYKATDAFSDVHDGGLTIEEVQPLVSKGLLRWEFTSKEDKPTDLIGNYGRTVSLTPKGLHLLGESSI